MERKILSQIKEGRVVALRRGSGLLLTVSRPKQWLHIHLFTKGGGEAKDPLPGAIAHEQVAPLTNSYQCILCSPNGNGRRCHSHSVTPARTKDNPSDNDILAFWHCCSGPGATINSHGRDVVLTTNEMATSKDPSGGVCGINNHDGLLTFLLALSLSERTVQCDSV